MLIYQNTHKPAAMGRNTGRAITLASHFRKV